ncbi:NAD(P)-binding protein [Mytilinidion resinicola]|uniref:NAD(P)-binding protein n=1 Tax=Mytilinidion resinicola TaxID=574789 RepID=A0A6A6Y3R6_9PEZI|nr:NAD(P)-binding protein [Mytilinidion resinicola]KAF2803422.1 NAD(P)-binding protein [Mytilinidion resinicola]
MGQNILVTGAAGYIGGSVLASFVTRTSGPINAASISAVVRSEDQVQALSKLGVNVIQVDLSDEMALNEAVVRNEIDIVVHIASSIDSRVVSHLITALGQRRKASGEEVFFIHSSVAALFATEGGWLYGEVKDTDQRFEKEKQIGGPHPVRETNILVTEHAKAQGVTSLNVVVPTVYGRGSGEWRKLSVNIPAYTRASIKHKIVYKFDKDGSPPAVHISDLTALYALLVEKILQKEQAPSGEKGYYFAMAHRAPWWDVMQHLADALHARGLVAEPKVQIWPSDEMAAEYLGFPLLYIRAMCTSTGQLVPVNAYRLGCQPKWDEKRFLESMDDEIRAVQELDKVKDTVFDSILPSSRN